MRMIGMVWVASIGCTGSPRHLDPPPPPAAVVPDVGAPAEPPPPGVSRVVFDVTDGPTLIQIKTLMGAGVGYVPLCTTPCVADLPAGQHDLSFQLRRDPGRGDNDLITVPFGTSAYRRTLGERSSRVGTLYSGYVIGSIGLMVVWMSGMSTLGSSSSDHAVRDAMLFGAGLMALGLGLTYAGWPTEQPGSVTQFATSPNK